MNGASTFVLGPGEAGVRGTPAPGRRRNIQILFSKATGRAPTEGCRVVKSRTSEPAGVTGRPSDAGWFVTVTSADEEIRPEAAAAATTKSTSAARRAEAARVGRFIGSYLSERSERMIERKKFLIAHGLEV